MQPPVNVTSGEAFTVKVEVLDEFGSRVFQYDSKVAHANNIILPTISILMEEWNDPRCPISCAKTGSVVSTIDTSSGTIDVSEGVVTFSNVTVFLPANVVRRDIYRQSVQAVRLAQMLSASAGTDSFRLGLNLSLIDDRVFGDYMTTPISYSATSTEVTERLQALPHVGRVSVSKNEISTVSLNYTEWVIRFKSLDDEIPLLEVFDNSGRSEFSIREIVVPKHYKLESVLGDPLHYATSRGFRLESAL